MIRLSQAGEYAIRGILFMASQPYGKVILARDVAEARGIPKPFLAKIFQSLSKSGILRSHRGRGGGFSLAKPAKEISLLDVIETVEGKMALNNCLLMDGCQNCVIIDACPVISVWSETQKRLVEVLKSTSVEQLSKTALSWKQRERRDRTQGHPVSMAPSAKPLVAGWANR